MRLVRGVAAITDSLSSVWAVPLKSLTRTPTRVAMLAASNTTNMILNALDQSRRRLGARPGRSPATRSCFIMRDAFPIDDGGCSAWASNGSLPVGQVPVQLHIPTHQFRGVLGVLGLQVQTGGECGTI